MDSFADLVRLFFDRYFKVDSMDVKPPKVTLTAFPANVTQAGPVVLTANASDNRGVTSVRFEEGGAEIKTVTEPPYTVTVQVSSGTTPRIFTAIALDAANNPGTDSVTVPVNIPVPDTTPPTITFFTATPSTLTAAGPVRLAAGATDNRGVTRVEFYNGEILPANKVGEALTAPYTVDVPLSHLNNGTQTFRAVAYDAAGNKAIQLATVTVTVPVPDTTGPIVSLSAVLKDRTVILTATATDASGIQNVKFYRELPDGTLKLIKQENGAPYEAFENVTEASNGTLKYVAIATDKSPAANTGRDSKTVTVNLTQTLTRSRKRSDYTLPNTTLTVTKAALLAGTWGQPNADGWYEIADFRCHSLVPGVPCILIKYMDVDLKVKIVRPVLDGLGTPGSNKGGLIVSENEGSVWVDDYLLFSSPPPVGGNGKSCVTARSVTMSGVRELKMTRGESYGTGGIYIDGIAQGGKYRNIYVGQAGGYNIRGTGYNADGTVRLTADNRLDKSAYLGYYAQFFQLNNAPDAPENSVVVEYWVAHTDPMAMIGRNAGQREDVWNIHSSGGAIIRHYLEENGLPWDPAFTGTQAVYGADPASPAGRGYGYSGSGGLGDGYVKTGFTGTPTANDVTHQVYAENGTSLNNANVGFGVTAGNRMRGKGLVSYVAGVLRSSAPGGYSRLAVKAAGDGTGEPGNNAVQAFQFYMAQGDKTLFYGHEMDDLRGSYNWIDRNGDWQQHVLYISDPNGSTGTGSSRKYNSVKFRQGGVELPPYGGGIAIIPKPKSVTEALSMLDQLRQERIDTFVAAGKTIGMSDRPPGDVKNYWNGVS